MQITSDLIESLLYEEESTTLDFKRDQYPFDHANDQAKSELPKDILAFANAFRRTDSFILIGVDDVKGGRSNVVSVSTQLDDARRQQFVNSKRPVTFSYPDFVHDGKPIGVIHIPIQNRPLYTKSDYGKVKKEVVYLRRGSSTAIANPDEVAQMGAHQVETQGAEPSLYLQLFDRFTGERSEAECPVESCYFDVPPEKDILRRSHLHRRQRTLKPCVRRGRIERR